MIQRTGLCIFNFAFFFFSEMKNKILLKLSVTICVHSALTKVAHPMLIFSWPDVSVPLYPCVLLFASFLLCISFPVCYSACLIWLLVSCFCQSPSAPAHPSSLCQILVLSCWYEHYGQLTGFWDGFLASSYFPFPLCSRTSCCSLCFLPRTLEFSIIWEYLSTTYRINVMGFTDILAADVKTSLRHTTPTVASPAPYKWTKLHRD